MGCGGVGGGRDQAVKTLSCWCSSLACKTVTWGPRMGKLFFKMLVHIKCDFLGAPSMLLLHFKEGLFIPLVKSSQLRQRGFLQVWNSFRKAFYTFPCLELTRSSHMVAVLIQKMFCCSKEKSEDFRKRRFLQNIVDLVWVNETNIFLPCADSSWQSQLQLLSFSDTKLICCHCDKSPS